MTLDHSNFDFAFFPPSFLELDQEKRYLIITIERLGLMNRLRAIIDWYFIAQFTNRTLIVNWKPNRDCNANFHDLFISYPKDMYVLRHPIPVVQDTIEWIEDVAYKYNYTIKYLQRDITNTGEQLRGEYFWGKRNFSFFASKDLSSVSEQILVSDYDSTLTIEDIPCNYYLIEHRQIFSQFLPQPYLLQLVDAVMEYFIDTIPIGVHIRIHDARYDWEIIPPKDGYKAKAFGDGATLDDFLTIMKQIEEAQSYDDPTSFSPSSSSSSSSSSFAPIITTKKRSLVKFFIASNDINVKKEIVKHFPTAITLQSEMISRETTAGIEHAFMEWLILTKCSLIINTFSSSFAMEAAIVGNIPLVSVWEHSFVFQENYCLKYCGDLQFAKYFTSNLTPADLEEGPQVNNRKVPGYAVVHSKCSKLPNWGIKDLLCIKETF